jgi:hypothetical protein
VQYAVPGGAIIEALFVERDILKLFTYRADRPRAIFADRKAMAMVN